MKEHTAVVETFRHEAKNGKDADIREWAGRRLPALEGHIKMAQALNDKLNGRESTAPSSHQMM